MDNVLGSGGSFNMDGRSETEQKIYIILAAHKGKFIYDRELGSEIYKVDISGADPVGEIEAKARDALSGLPWAEVVGVSLADGKITVSVEVEGKVSDFVLSVGEV